MTVFNSRRFAGPLLGVGMALAIPASAAVIDFDGATPVVGATHPYVEDGFQLAAPGGAPNHYDISSSGIVFDNYSGLWNSAVRLSSLGGGAFDLMAFDVVAAGTSSYGPPPLFELVTVPCASSCQVRSSAGGLANLVEGRMEFSTPEWRSVDWIDFLVPSAIDYLDTTTVKLDNIEVTPSPVPGPPALALLATGLVGLFTWRQGMKHPRRRVCTPHSKI